MKMVVGKLQRLRGRREEYEGRRAGELALRGVGVVFTHLLMVRASATPETHHTATAIVDVRVNAAAAAAAAAMIRPTAAAALITSTNHRASTAAAISASKSCGRVAKFGTKYTREVSESWTCRSAP